MRTVNRNSDDYVQFCLELYRDALRVSTGANGIEEEWVGVTKKMWMKAAQSTSTQRLIVAPRKHEN